MRRGIQRGIGALKQQASPPQQQVQDAVARKSRGSLIDRLLGSPRPTQQPPLSEPLDIPLPAYNPPAEPPKAQVTRLSNGAHIAAEESENSILSLGMYISTGSKDEQPYNSGASHLLERCAFMSTSNRTHFRLTRELEAMGASVHASASRDCIVYTLDTVRSHMPEAVELLTDSVLNSTYYSWEVEDATSGLSKELEEKKKNSDAMLDELLHSTAFDGGYGKPLMCDPANLTNITGATLRQFVRDQYQANRTVLAASGCNHDDLLAVAEPLFSILPASSGHEESVTRYRGGYGAQRSRDQEVNLALAFKSPGWQEDQSAAAMVVLQTLLGGGMSFSSGGPGKGMMSRLYQRVLHRHGWVASCTAYASMFNDVGLFGIQGMCEGNKASELVDIMCQELHEVAEGRFSEKELQRAKWHASAGVGYSLESSSMRTEDIARQVLTYGERKPISYFISIMEQLTRNDIAKLAASMLQTRPTLAAFGNTSYMPNYDTVRNRFA